MRCKLAGLDWEREAGNHEETSWKSLSEALTFCPLAWLAIELYDMEVLQEQPNAKHDGMHVEDEKFKIEEATESWKIKASNAVLLPTRPG